MPVRYLDPARDEAFEAAEFYESQAAGLGAELFGVVDEAIELLLANPNAGAPYELGTRRFVLPRFPFSLIYSLEGDEILIVAVAHHRRRPVFWRDRRG